MRTTHKIKEKKTYSPPQIEIIKLDNEISLQLASDDKPMGEPEWDAKANQPMSNDPYKMA